MSRPDLLRGLPLKVHALADRVSFGGQSRSGASTQRFTIGDTGEPIGCKIAVESQVQPAVLDELCSGAHDFVVRQQYSAMTGWGQVVLPDSKTSGNLGASDPRADGAAEPEAIPLE